MKTMTATPRIYVGTYAKYNSGNLGGKWIDIEDYSDKEEFLEACKELHSDEADPELMYQDFEGFPKEFYSESDIPEALFEWLSLDEYDRQTWAMYLEATGYSYEETSSQEAKDKYAGTADSEADFAEELASDTGAIPSDLPNWIVIDWEATWNCNLRYDYNTATDDDGKVWFFHNN